jgi:acyl-CoA reductase-like NAD-dependent aldehyde dehydrogenase
MVAVPLGRDEVSRRVAVIRFTKRPLLFTVGARFLAGIVNVNSPTINDEIHAPMGGVRDSGWGRTGPRSPEDFSDVIWINSHIRSEKESQE